MKTNISKLLALLAATTTLAGPLSADTTSIQGGIAYRQDSLTWHAKSHANVTPQTRSDMHFEDIEIVLFATQAKTTFGSSEAFFKGAFDYGWIVDGRVREQLTVNSQRRASQHARSGYKDSGEFRQVSVHNDVRRHSFVWDLDFTLGYPLHCWCETMSVAPTLGFALNRQQIRVHGKTLLIDAEDTFSDSCHHGEKRHGSQFRTSFWGPYVGVNFVYSSPNCWDLYSEVEVHFGKVRRDRDSHTNHDHLDHLGRSTNFWGPSIKIGASYPFYDCMFIDASVYYSKFLSDCHNDDITWSTANIRLDLGYIF